MLKVNKQLNAIAITKDGPKNVSPLEQKLWMKGYRCYIEKIEDGMRWRSYFRGKECIRVGDIAKDSEDVPQMVVI